MAMQRERVALPLLCAMVLQLAMGSQAVASDQGAIGAIDESETAALVDLLTERGMAQDEAQLVVNSLTLDDIRVLVENPDMLQHAGDDASTSMWAAVGIILVILLLIGAAAAAG